MLTSKITQIIGSDDDDAKYGGNRKQQNSCLFECNMKTHNATLIKGTRFI